MREPPGPLWGRAASCCLLPRWCSGCRRARPLCVPVGGGPPARLGDLTLFGAAPRSPPVPSGPSGALHTGGAGCADDWLGVSSRSPARPCRRVACFVGLGRCVCRWAAARPRDRHTRASLGVVDLEARPGPAAAHRHRGRVPVVLQTSWAFAADGARRVGSMPCQAPTP